MKIKYYRFFLLFALIYPAIAQANIDVSQNVWVANTNAPSTNGWSSVASSADGSKLVAVGNGNWISNNPCSGWIYTSTDFGATWTHSNNAPTAYWTSVASSTDGSRLIAATVAANSGGRVYTSTNSGVTWAVNTNLRYAPWSALWSAVTSSGDGSKLVAAEGYGIQGNPIVYPRYCVSTNFGATWAMYGPSPYQWNCTSVAASTDGSMYILGVYGVAVGTTNGGTERLSIGNFAQPSRGFICMNAPVAWWTSVAASANGSRLVAVQRFYSTPNPPAQIYISSNSGTNWTLSTSAPSTNWSAVASSADGSKLVAAVIGGQIYTSTNFGTNWMVNVNSPSTNWSAVASSADGSKLVAVVHGGQIYTLSLPK